MLSLGSPLGQRLSCSRRVVTVYMVRTAVLFAGLLLAAASALAQGGPPFYTNDPGTPGPKNWEINVGYMPFVYSDQSVAHVPDLDINFGLGDRIQLTYENAWLRVREDPADAKFGLGQSNFGVKWRFYDAGESGWLISTFPQGFVNNPNHSVKRGITPAEDSFLLPVEFSHKAGPVDVNFELGYNFVHNGPDGWLGGLVVGHTFKTRWEVAGEFYSQGTFHPYSGQPVFDGGVRYRLHTPFILLLMAGRGLEAASHDQPSFVGYFGIQILLPPKASEPDNPSVP